MGDGDGCTVFVDVYTDEREKQNLPREIQDAVIRRRDARAKRDYKTADALQKQIQQANYKSVPASTIHTIALNCSPN